MRKDLQVDAQHRCMKAPFGMFPSQFRPHNVCTRRRRERTECYVA